MWLTLFIYVTVSSCCFALRTTRINLSFQQRQIHVPKAPYLHLRRCQLMMVVEDDVAAVKNQWDPKAGPKLDFNEDYYSVLEIESTASPKELKKAYFKIVFIHHPDRKTSAEDKQIANQQMMVINGAYRVLKAPATRQSYDRARQQGLFGAAAGVKGSGRNPVPTGVPTEGYDKDAYYQAQYNNERARATSSNTRASYSRLREDLEDILDGASRNKNSQYSNSTAFYDQRKPVGGSFTEAFARQDNDEEAVEAYIARRNRYIRSRLASSGGFIRSSGSSSSDSGSSVSDVDSIRSRKSSRGKGQDGEEDEDTDEEEEEEEGEDMEVFDGSFVHGGTPFGNGFDEDIPTRSRKNTPNSPKKRETISSSSGSSSTRKTTSGSSSSNTRVDGGWIFVTDDDNGFEHDDDIVDDEYDDDDGYGGGRGGIDDDEDGYFKEQDQLLRKLSETFQEGKQSVDSFISDAYDQLERSSTRNGVQGEITVALRVLLGLIKQQDKNNNNNNKDQER